MTPATPGGEPVVRRRHGERTNTKDVEGLADRRVGILADGDERVPGCLSAAPERRRVAGHHQRRQVAGRPAGDEAAPGALGEAGLGGQHTESLVLGYHDPCGLEPEVPCRDEHETNMSKRSDALVGAAGMNDKKRGLSHDTTAVASLSTNSFRTCAGVVALGSHEAGQLVIERFDESAEIQGHRVHGESIPARGEDQVRHCRVVVEHGVPPSGGRPAVPGPVPRARPRQASSARLATSCREAPVFAATSATSSNSGLARPPAPSCGRSCRRR